MSELTELQVSEFALATGLFRDESLIHVYGTRLTQESFTSPLCGRLWKWASEFDVAGTPFEIVTVWESHKKTLHDLGGIDALMQIQRGFYSASSADQYVQAVAQEAARRKLIGVANRIKESLEDPYSSVPDLWAEIESAIMGLRPGGERMTSERRKERLIAWYESVEQRANHPGQLTGIDTGFPAINRLTNGLQRSDLILIGARTSVGKSAFAIQLATNANRKGSRVAIFSLEMGDQQVYDRAASAIAGIEYGRFRTGRFEDEDWTKISMAMVEMESLTIVDDRGMTARDIAAEMRQLKHSEGLDLVIVDYANLIQEDSMLGDVTGEKFKRITQTLRSAAKQCDCAMVVVAQINRAVEQRQNKRPLLSDLSDSKALEDAADVVMLLYRDDYYDPDSERKNIMEINIAKQRNGPTGMVELVYLRNRQSLVSLEPERS